MSLSRIALSLGLCVHAAVTAAAGWPEIPDAEIRLSAREIPDAPAIILRREGDLHIEGGGPYFFSVYTRIKVLTDAGRDQGTVSIPSSDVVRMKDLEGRVHLPDGRIVDLPVDAKFERKYSAAYQRMLTSFVVPEVTAGCIVEYRYRLYFDAPIHTDPWFFQAPIPTRESTISCHFDVTARVRIYPVATTGKVDQKTGTRGETGISTVTMHDLPAVPHELGGPPFADLASRVYFLLESVGQGRATPLLESWDSLVRLVQGTKERGYFHARSRQAEARQKGRDLGKDVGPAGAAARIHAFVRDLRTLPGSGVEVSDRTCDEVLKAAEGTPIEKALLCQAMLEGVSISSSIGWTSPRDLGRIDRQMVNPAQMRTVLCVADVEGKKLFLDPADRNVVAGILAPELEDVPCLLVDGAPATWATTLLTPPEGSLRDAKLGLIVGETGKIAGKGSLVFTGHHAWERLSWKETERGTVEAWQAWLESKLPGFDVRDVVVTERSDAHTVSVAWSVEQRAEDVSSGEVALVPASLLAQTRNPFTAPPDKRLTPVHLSFEDSDRLEVLVFWSEGFHVTSRPKLPLFSGPTGSYAASLVVDEAKRTATYVRRMDTTMRDVVGKEDYADLRGLCATAVKGDAEILVLGR